MNEVNEMTAAKQLAVNYQRQKIECQQLVVKLMTSNNMSELDEAIASLEQYKKELAELLDKQMNEVNEMTPEQQAMYDELIRDGGASHEEAEYIAMMTDDELIQFVADCGGDTEVLFPCQLERYNKMLDNRD